MRKNKKSLIIFIISMVLIVSGIVLINVGFANGGEIHITSTKYGTISFLSWSNNEVRYDNQTYTSTNSIKQIEIDAEIGGVEVYEADTLEIETFNIDEDYISFKEVNGVVELEVDSENRGIQLSIMNFNFNDNQKIRVGVPKSCESLSIENNIGDITIEGITINYLEASLDIGSLNAKNTYVKNADLSSDIGELYFQGDVENKLETSNNIGSTKLYLNQDENAYNFNLKSGLGDIKLNNSTYNNSFKQTQSNNETKRHIYAKSDIGEIQIHCDK